MAELTRYPDGNGFALKQALAAKLGVDTAGITLGNGSNDILELVTRAFVGPEHEVVFSDHAFAVYPLSPRRWVPRRCLYRPRIGVMTWMPWRRPSPRRRVVFIANPTNPTGTWIERARLRPSLTACRRT
ncbi:aminotransferase class I/II-fold pyridoxal phosphate-dependent enzyme [Halopseudomonas pachastrellae]|nr:aminotransferase class I/II-fold pyridoxal phosphate-dependent enzyme [Halopseudomonas pachastrellae]